MKKWSREDVDAMKKIVKKADPSQLLFIGPGMILPKMILRARRRRKKGQPMVISVGEMRKVLDIAEKQLLGE